MLSLRQNSPRTMGGIQPSESLAVPGVRIHPSPVWHVSLHFGEAIKSARGARLTRGRGPGECQLRLLSAKFAQNSLFAILACPSANLPTPCGKRSEEHTSELQSRSDLVCRLLLEK